MIFVFLAFVFGGQRVIAEFGIGLAAAVFLDAFVLRTVLVPAADAPVRASQLVAAGWLDRRCRTCRWSPTSLRRPSRSLVARDSRRSRARRPRPRRSRRSKAHRARLGRRGADVAPVGVRCVEL